MVDMLESWNDGSTKSAITDFVGRVTEEGGPDYVEPAARVAVYDNDGTLWCEKPMPIQLDFTIRKLAELARDHPSPQDQQPYQAAYQNDLKWMSAAMIKHYQGDDRDLKLLMGAVTAAFDMVSVEAYYQARAVILRRGGSPHLRAAVSELWIPAHGGAAAIPGGQRLHQLHRLRR